MAPPRLSGTERTRTNLGVVKLGDEGMSQRRGHLGALGRVKGDALVHEVDLRRTRAGSRSVSPQGRTPRRLGLKVRREGQRGLGTASAEQSGRASGRERGRVGGTASIIVEAYGVPSDSTSAAEGRPDTCSTSST